MTEPIDRRIRELTRESPRLADDLDELAHPRGEMSVWFDEDDEPERDDEDDEDD
jgi:hypothetical protein